MKALIGKKIVAIRELSAEECDREGWDIGFKSIAVIELDDGTVVFPSRDGEGNGPGVLFGYKGKKGFYVFPDKENT